ncbi:putative gtpase activating protein [Rosellinia necatrix]|uniref:Putative gtpase activating protein n=1 Tax=Rosellinia necatrix TaxID=77044 RepID=A0A1W2THL7_ROSNE|nr:putative gtpase activating protein [Rosellinia necatrix]
MPPSPGDGGPPSQDSKVVGGLASVFKGLAGAAKLTKSSPTLAQSSRPSTINAEITEQLSAVPISHALPHGYIELFEQLKDGAMNERVAAANSLRIVVANYPHNPVLSIWHAAKDLIDPANPEAARTAGWELLAECVKHPLSSDLERKEYFQTISTTAKADDFHLQLMSLINLSQHGREISGFDYDLFPLLSTWLQLSFDMARSSRAAVKKRGLRSKSKSIITREDKSFWDLFALISDAVKFHSVIAGDGAVEALVDTLLNICSLTSNIDDMRACCGVLTAIITFGVLPGNRLRQCVQILSSIDCLVPDAQKDAWNTIRILCRSHTGQATIRVLLNILNDAGTSHSKDKIRHIRGSLSILQKLVTKSSEKGYPPIPYAILVDGLSKVVEAISFWKVCVDILKLVNALFCDSQGFVNHMLVDEDWAPLFDIAEVCAAGAFIQEGGDPIDAATVKESITRELYVLVSQVETIVKSQQSPLIQRQDCILFFTKIHTSIPGSTATLVLEYYKEFRCCFPSDARWKTNLDIVLNFFKDRKRSTDVRLRALHLTTEVYDMLELIDHGVEPDFVFDLVKRLLVGVTEETDITVLQETVAFSVSVATAINFHMFCYITDALRGVVFIPSPTQASGVQSSAPTSQTTQSLADVVTKGFGQIFFRVMNVDVAKAIRLFDTLISIARLDNQIDARLTAMQILFRVRADWANRIFITTYTETSNLATTLCRTEVAIARKLAEDTSQQTRYPRTDTGGSSRSARGVSFSQGQFPERTHSHRVASVTRSANNTYQPLWVASDSDALPETPPGTASPVLHSYVPDTSNESALNGDVALLPIGSWLETLLSLLKTGCDWEIYSFILVHLPSQLSNHAVFNSAVPQLRELRRLLCEQIGRGIPQEPPSASGLRKADIAICLLHSLTMILSYHRHFQKPDEDEIVWAFVQAITTWERSAKCCIHALTICCHELPSSTGKALIPILQRMSQIITQPYVAMHILEFLACLSRLPSLYVNFHQEDYRIIFGICLRYLQFVRGQKQHNRPSSLGDTSQSRKQSLPADNPSHPNASDDLPQYVYTLAYHVIIFWFLVLKLTDRAGQVQWIAKNLFTDVDGSQVLDEQAQTSFDFMQRVTYADVDESAADPLFTTDRFGKILKRRWLIGNSIVTVEQAATSGWAQITKRQPSGTSSFTICESFHPPPAHQQPIDDSTRDSNITGSTNSVLPSHLLIQLLSSIPQHNDMSRPIPLPDSEAVDMAVRVFDRNSTLDGHKVGVIYIGEGQVGEADILANISGSSDYIEFLNGLGTLTKLKGATFNLQGLDRQYGTDGEYTFCWRDRVTELVFHVTTQMPTDLERDPLCTQKKRHIGNDFVNIIFNDSGFPFKFDTFPSEFNYVNIVIAPESRASFVATRLRTPKDVEDSFYKVQVMSKPGFPEISPASETKIVSLKALPDFIRLLALNASFFSHVWANREGGEHISSWGNRLRAINRLRDKYEPKAAPNGPPTPSPPGTANSHGNPLSSGIASQLDVSRPGNMVRESLSGLSLRRASVATFFANPSDQGSHRSSMLSTTTADNTEVGPPTEAELLVESLDFSRWA